MTLLQWRILENVRSGRNFDHELPCRGQDVIDLEHVGWVLRNQAANDPVFVIGPAGEEVTARARALGLGPDQPLTCVAREPVHPLDHPYPEVRCGRPGTAKSSVFWPLCGTCRALMAEVELRYRRAAPAVPSFKYQ